MFGWFKGWTRTRKRMDMLAAAVAQHGHSCDLVDDLRHPGMSYVTLSAINVIERQAEHVKALEEALRKAIYDATRHERELNATVDVLIDLGVLPPEIGLDGEEFDLPQALRDYAAGLGCTHFAPCYEDQHEPQSGILRILIDDATFRELFGGAANPQ